MQPCGHCEFGSVAIVRYRPAYRELPMLAVGTSAEPCLASLRPTRRRNRRRV